MFSAILFILLSAFCRTDTTADNTTTGIQSQSRFVLIELPYAYDALEPYISSETMALHHGRHLQSYVDKLNALIAGTRYALMPIEEIVVQSDSSIYDAALFDNAGQLLNHNLYFLQFTPQGSDLPQGMLLDAILAEWGSFDNFRSLFVKSGTELFGSGWLWLATDYEGRLYIVQEPNGGNPVTKGLIPLLGFDLWEHAYYLDYNNRRREYLDALWNIIDWQVVESRYEATGVVENRCQQAIDALPID